MRILIVGKYPPIQGGVSAETYWLAQNLSELSHKVSILTNADEVEDESRLSLDDEDRALLTGYWRRDSIVLRSTKKERRHLYIPQGNPSVSKLVTLGLDLVAKEKPDVIWAFYLEPYGVAALLLSMLTGVPYTIRNAGSDIGRLMSSEQLRGMYAEVFRRAKKVYSTKRHLESLIALGVDPENVETPTSSRVPGNVFFPAFYDEPQRSTEKVVFGVYGKVNEAKGSPQLLKALALLKKRDVALQVKALWGGRHLPSVLELKRDLGLTEEEIEVRPFVAHWKVPEFIRSCHAILFLENNFSIAFHGPGIPVEVLSCGRYLVTTEEVAAKARSANLLTPHNSLVLPRDSLEPEKLAAVLEDIVEKQPFWEMHRTESAFDATLYSRLSREKIRQQFERLERSL
ncbi:MAG TPA: glycosyltransferase [Candidatus Paceibacterota bacterium]|nr:glycosyltransferase [Candidatus Paceibacterota bacterium]